MNKPMYEIIENIIINLFGAVGIISGILMIGFVGAYNWIPAVACLIVSIVCFCVSVPLWEEQEKRKER